MSKIVGPFEIIDHGVEHSQYFQGCGVALSRFTDCATGIGDNASEALEDALECLAQGGWDVARIEASTDYKDACALSGDAHEECGTGEEHEGCELHYYVSVRVAALTLGEWLKDARVTVDTFTFRDPVGTYLGNGKWEENTLEDVIKRGESIAWSRLESAKLEDADLMMFPYASGGDYTNSSAVEKSNHRVARGMFPQAINVFGSYWAYALVLPLASEMTTELAETLEGLMDYPLIDESDHSECEQEQQTEEWDSWARSDFQCKLAESFDAVENTRAADWVRDLPTEEIDRLYWEACEKSGHYPEMGCDPHFYITENVAAIGADDLPPFPPMPRETGCQAHTGKPVFGCADCILLRDAFASYMGAKENK